MADEKSDTSSKTTQEPKTPSNEPITKSADKPNSPNNQSITEGEENK